MSDPIFRRSDYTSLWLTLSSSESLGILDAGYLEDFAGVDGQITLHAVNAGTDTTVLMGESGPESAPHEVFTGMVPLDTLPNDLYLVQGKVRDLAGNVTIVTEVASPLGTERVERLAFVLEAGTITAIHVGSLALRGGLRLTASVIRRPLTAPLRPHPIRLPGGRHAAIRLRLQSGA